MSKLKKIFVVIILAIFALCIFAYFSLEPKQKVIPGYVSTDIRYISSEEGGRLLSLNIKEGQIVDNGGLLYSLNSNQGVSKEKTLSDVASANIISAKAELKYAKDQYLRQKNLLEYNGTSKKDYQQAYSNYIKAKAKVDSATVRSVEKGFVYQIFYRPGEMIPAYSPVISIINPQDVYVIFYVSKEDLDKVHLDQNIDISTDSGKSTKAKVSHISKDAEYTPPLLYGINSDSEISFEVKAMIKYSADESAVHIGEPVRVVL